MSGPVQGPNHAARVGRDQGCTLHDAAKLRIVLGEHQAARIGGKDQSGHALVDHRLDPLDRLSGGHAVDRQAQHLGPDPRRAQ